MSGWKLLPDGCGKRIYISRRAARDATRKIGVPIRLYWCPVCRGWHATRRDR